MRKKSLLVLVGIASVMGIMDGTGNAAELLAVDFGGSANPVETGFTGQSVASAQQF
jgi:hypothetical protein